jgi:hypothetical protein
MEFVLDAEESRGMRDTLEVQVNCARSPVAIFGLLRQSIIMCVVCVCTYICMYKQMQFLPYTWSIYFRIYLVNSYINMQTYVD